MHSAIRFLNEGWRVVGLDNMNDYYSPNLKRDRLIQIQSVQENSPGEFVFHEEDLNQGFLSEVDAKNFDLCLHLAAQAGVRYSLVNPRAYLEANVMGFQEVLEFSSRNPSMRLFYASSSSVYGQSKVTPFTEDAETSTPESFYAATKKANELMAHAYFKTHQRHSVGLRFFTVYGPWGRPDMAPMLFASAAIKREQIRVFNFGKQKRDFTYISDIVESIYRLATSSRELTGAQIFNIGRGHPTQLLDFIQSLEKGLNRTMEKELVPAQRGDVSSTHASCAALQDIIDYVPVVELDDGIGEFCKWYLKYCPDGRGLM